MSIFDLHPSVLADYRNFVRSFFTVATTGSGPQTITSYRRSACAPGAARQA